jgi:entry exclusion lipoprotein TrbK
VLAPALLPGVSAAVEDIESGTVHRIALALAALVVAALTGCGGAAKPEATQASARSAAVDEICEQARRDMLNVLRHHVSSPEPGAIGHEVREGALAAEGVDRTALRRVRAAHGGATAEARIMRGIEQLKTVAREAGDGSGPNEIGLFTRLSHAVDACGVRD